MSLVGGEIHCNQCEVKHRPLHSFLESILHLLEGIRIEEIVMMGKVYKNWLSTSVATSGIQYCMYSYIDNIYILGCDYCYYGCRVIFSVYRCKKEKSVLENRKPVQ